MLFVAFSNTSLGFAPLPAPITPRSSSMSISLAARAYPTPSFLCRYVVEDLSAYITVILAFSY